MATHAHHTRTVELDSGETGNHLVVNYFHWDAHRQELSAHLSLYKSKVHYEAGKPPMRPIMAKIRANGEVFTKTFGHDQIGPMLDKILQYAHTQSFPAVISGVGLGNSLLDGTTTLTDGTIHTPAAAPVITSAS